MTINAAERPKGDCEELDGVFTCGFPLHVTDLGPSQPVSVIPIASRAASAAAAQPRIAAAGGAAIQDLRVETEAIRVRIHVMYVSVSACH